MARTLDGLGDLALIFHRGACDAARQDLALLVDELQQEVSVLVVDVFDAVLLETAVFLSFGIYGYGSQILDVVVVCLCHVFFDFRGSTLGLHFGLGSRGRSVFGLGCFLAFLLVVGDGVLVKLHSEEA